MCQTLSAFWRVPSYAQPATEQDNAGKCCRKRQSLKAFFTDTAINIEGWLNCMRVTMESCLDCSTVKSYELYLSTITHDII